LDNIVIITVTVIVVVVVNNFMDSLKSKGGSEKINKFIALYIIWHIMSEPGKLIKKGKKKFNKCRRLMRQYIIYRNK